MCLLDANHGSPDIPQSYETKKQAREKLREKIEAIVIHGQQPGLDTLGVVEEMFFRQLIHGFGSSLASSAL